MNENQKIKNLIQESIDVKSLILQDEVLLDQLSQVVMEMVNALRNGCKILLAGNGGSAADAQHIAAELSGRFYHDREPLFAEALHVNTSYLTATANDYGFEHVYSRLVRAKGNLGDILICLSTSGTSENIILAAEEAKKRGIIAVSMTGKSGGELAPICNYRLSVPSEDTPRIQEAHILLGHILCELVEERMLSA